MVTGTREGEKRRRENEWGGGQDHVCEGVGKYRESGNVMVVYSSGGEGTGGSH